MDGDASSEEEDGLVHADDTASDAADSEDQEEEPFDITLAASHAYMGPGLKTVRGRTLLEAGWEGKVPVIAHHGVVFPGETVPLLLKDVHDAVMLAAAIEKDKLFGLLCPDETGTVVSGYGVVCEVFEVGGAAGAGPGPGAGAEGAVALTAKARAVRRFRLVTLPARPVPVMTYVRARYEQVRVLREVLLREPLRAARLAAPRTLRRADQRLDRRLRSIDAVTTPWPLFVYEIMDYDRMRQTLLDYFKTINLENLPEEPVALSFWVASNLSLTARDRLSLFLVDDALLRIYMGVRFIATKSVLCCAMCGGEVARREDEFAMSSDGVHANYTNIGGYMHDLVTVSRANNATLAGRPSAQFSWFPGYAWTVANCAACAAHIGWRFDAERRSLRPQQFFGLCRNYVSPRAARPPAPPTLRGHAALRRLLAAPLPEDDDLHALF